MNLRKLFIFTTALLALTASSFAMAHGNVKKTTMNVPHTTITFDAGSSMLTEADKTSLRNLVRNAEEKGAIEHITVAAWSDKALPRQGQKLLDVDRNLADSRSDAIKTFLKEQMEVKDVDTFSMAETANWLSRTFNTEDAELKSVFGRTGAENPVNKDEFLVIKREGGPSMAVAVVEFKTIRPSTAPAAAPAPAVVP